MTGRCSVCQISSEERAAIDAALREGASLQVISNHTGVSKSSLWRHSKHLEGGKPTLPAQKAVCTVARNENTSVSPSVALEQALNRNELLWNEALDGLEAAKQPIVVTRPDGSKLEVPGDLRARAGFIRAGRDVLHLDSELRGLLDPQARHVTVNVLQVIMSPKEQEPDTIDIQPLPADEPARPDNNAG